MTMNPRVIPASVAITTIGRPTLLQQCLESLAECQPRPAEVVVIDQSKGFEVMSVVRHFAAIGARHIACTGTGIGLGRNLGLATATHEIVLVTDDDCTVASDWAARAYRLARERPEAIFTGRVLPGGTPDDVPSTNAADTPRRYVGSGVYAVLYTGNMVAHRSEVLALGGFDERIQPAATDNEFCYRWLKAGRVIHFEPELVVWHHDWRTPEELERRYVAYAVGQGMFYAKHLRQGDWQIVRRLVGFVYQGFRGTAARVVHGRPASTDWRQGILRGLPVGLIRGWRAFKDSA